ncbi:unnamed protein product [Brassicogethes aeneus]|uniref:Aminomethyltransferase n=1 Tax=Brassicogethes aeneus TaxID=1431903 RepID=A0A9P0AV82_BRAAE|nr:unnamed protein product [Brassicogethes aeneus]
MFKSVLRVNLKRNFVCRTFASERTALYDFHVNKGGKIVNFGGYLLPVQYNDLSIVNSHLFTRKNASIFDVSHMLQTEIFGKGCVEFMESLCTADIQNLGDNSGSLTVFTNDRGGILDDLIVNKIHDEHLYVVSNAAMKESDKKIMMTGLEKYKKSNTSSNITIKFHDPSETSLLALQGPKAAENLQKIVDCDLSQLYFMNTTSATVANVNCRVTRCGYTGEDGFEISIPSEKSVEIAEELLKNEDVKLAGLGARDSLRLEAGLCLYGNDISENTTPIDGALTWLVSKRRREQKNFPGAEQILEKIRNASEVKRVGLQSENGPPARQGAFILNDSGEQLGTVTSGCPSPSLGKNIAMGYIPTKFNKVGTKVNLKIRDKLYNAVITKMPFVKSNYYQKPK